jgi:hypothetical protein
MHQLSNNSLFNHYDLACYHWHRDLYHHVAFSQASDSDIDASAEDLKQRRHLHVQV